MRNKWLWVFSNLVLIRKDILRKLFPVLCKRLVWLFFRHVLLNFLALFVYDLVSINNYYTKPHFWVGSIRDSNQLVIDTHGFFTVWFIIVSLINQPIYHDHLRNQLLHVVQDCLENTTTPQSILFNSCFVIWAIATCVRSEAMFRNINEVINSCFFKSWTLLYHWHITFMLLEILYCVFNIFLVVRMVWIHQQLL